MNSNRSNDSYQTQRLLNINNNLNNSYPLINNNFENLRYNIRNASTENILDINSSEINYCSFHSNDVKNSINYFKSKINTNNGLNYYKLISELSSKCSSDNTILKTYIPISLQNIGVFYTQKELLNFYYALGCEDLSINTFTLTKFIDTIIFHSIKKMKILYILYIHKN